MSILEAGNRILERVIESHDNLILATARVRFIGIERGRYRSMMNYRHSIRTQDVSIRVYVCVTAQGTMLRNSRVRVVNMQMEAATTDPHRYLRSFNLAKPKGFDEIRLHKRISAMGILLHHVNKPNPY